MYIKEEFESDTPKFGFSCGGTDSAPPPQWQARYERSVGNRVKFDISPVIKTLGLKGLRHFLIRRNFKILTFG